MFGVKVVEKTADYKLIRFSFWVPESVIKRVIENVSKDATVQGKHLKITVGHRLMRVEEVKP